MYRELALTTKNKNEVVDISKEIHSIVEETGIKNGICNVYVPHATASIIINENDDPNICKDFSEALKELIPEGKWLHDSIDNNGAAHIKAAMIGPSETIPIKDNKLQLGTWQSVMLCEFDGPKLRKIIITILGD